MDFSFTLPKKYDPKQEEYSVCYATGAQNLAACSLLELLDDEEFHQTYDINNLAWMDLKDLKELVDELTATGHAIDGALDRLMDLLNIKDPKDEIPNEKDKMMMQEKLDALATY